MGIEITVLKPSEAGKLARLIHSQSPDYVQYFHPFPFDETSLAQRLADAKGDYYRGIYVDEVLAGFFMLRGFDEGYERPSFGVFVAREFAGRGLARMALLESLRWSREQQINAVMLKVHPQHPGARKLYETVGFSEVGVCERTGCLMMEWRNE